MDGAAALGPLTLGPVSSPASSVLTLPGSAQMRRRGFPQWPLCLRVAFVALLSL